MRDTFAQTAGTVRDKSAIHADGWDRSTGDFHVRVTGWQPVGRGETIFLFRTIRHEFLDGRRALTVSFPEREDSSKLVRIYVVRTDFGNEENDRSYDSTSATYRYQRLVRDTGPVVELLLLGTRTLRIDVRRVATSTDVF